MSPLLPKAEIRPRNENVRFVPIADIPRGESDAVIQSPREVTAPGGSTDVIDANERGLGLFPGPLEHSKFGSDEPSCLD